MSAGIDMAETRRVCRRVLEELPPVDGTELRALITETKGHARALVPEVEACISGLEGEMRETAMRVLGMTRALFSGTPPDLHTQLHDAGVATRSLLTLIEFGGAVSVVRPAPIDPPGT